jgi:hypothetical protein
MQGASAAMSQVGLAVKSLGGNLCGKMARTRISVREHYPRTRNPQTATSPRKLALSKEACYADV